MDMQTIVTFVGVIFASTGFWTFMTAYIERKTRKRTDLEEGMLCILHDRVYFLCRQYIAKKAIDHTEYDNLNKMYNVYHKMGGNGTAERLMKEVEKLPITEELP